NLGADPEVRYSAAGNAVTKIRVATSEQWKDKQSGETQERTEWHRITFFGRLAEIAGEHLKKGSQVYVEGKLQTSTYEKDGQTHYSTDIIASELQMLGSKQRTSADENTFGGSGRGQERQEKPVDPFDDADLPF